MALSHLRDLLEDIPAAPEPVPFDISTLGFASVELVQPTTADLTNDGRIDPIDFMALQRGCAADDPHEADEGVKAALAPDVAVVGAPNNTSRALTSWAEVTA